MNTRRILFLSLGLTRAHPPRGHLRERKLRETLLEPQGTKTCRRNILALSSVLVVAGLAGAEPQDLQVFGITASGNRGIAVIGVAVILLQIYWFIQKYLHLEEDGVIERLPADSLPGAERLKITGRNELALVRRDTDLVSNWAAFGLTLAAWGFIGYWIVDGTLA